MGLVEKIKEFICRITKKNCVVELKQISNLTQTNQKLEEQYLEVLAENSALKDKVYVDIYRGHHTEAKITYQRNIKVGKTQYENIQIDVRQFITPNNFEIYENIKKAGLFYTGKEDLDELIPKLYYLAKKKYGYAGDDQFGMSEYWLFPYETLFFWNSGRKTDCEDASHVIGSYFACAGVPRDRWWVSCGNTRDGFGHSTVFAKDDNDIWRHLNSTAKWYQYDSLLLYPNKDDETDLIGIKDFWFSFNDYYSISDFETACADISFNKTKEVKNIQIRSKE